MWSRKSHFLIVKGHVYSSLCIYKELSIDKEVKTSAEISSGAFNVKEDYSCQNYYKITLSTLSRLDKS